MAVERVLLAEPRGFCAGVVRAIDVVEDALEIFGAPVYVRREIVHNPFVVEGLRQKGAVFVEEVDEAPEGAVTIFSAHGVSPAVRALAEKRRLRVIDATCPLVTKVHLEAVRYARHGYSILLVGHAGHDEVVGTMGEVPDAVLLVGTVEEAEAVTVPDAQRVAVVSQTTLSMDDTSAILEVLRRRFPALVQPPRGDICFATQNRQIAVKKLAPLVDVVLVLGAENSSNSQRLREVAEAQGRPAYLIASLKMLNPAWLENVRVVGVTSGASTPDFLVDEMFAYFQGLGVKTFERVRAVEEDVQFTLPKEIVRARAGSSPAGGTKE